ncbi:hypothetical protein CONLIGDRAFT_717941 [Coniochaeta ligniaria NRRL 30616]|uniref:Copper transport protein n=1 Tax=Coniochaeta ligniaria NRRL 30616 TaxID=1408157 RepID=A0A1J7J591_9PEZI|nr:hypothetical protein CONLIGDRAFT_717941 [Coniochaeta ligniaria NRRL 30616]
MDMPDMEGMTGSPVATDMAGMPGIDSAASSSPASVPTAAVIGTPNILVSAASETAHIDEAAATSSIAQMSSMDGMSGGMSSAFHFGLGDTLWTTPLTPTTGQGYAGAIVLLILMAIFLRFLTTLRGMAEKRWNPNKPSRCNGDDADNYLKMGQSWEDEAERDSGHRWNTKIQLTRALSQLMTMTTGYLLMLAVMTFNLGYLFAILAGGFLGELALGWIKH